MLKQLFDSVSICITFNNNENVCNKTTCQELKNNKKELKKSLFVNKLPEHVSTYY